MSAEFHMGSSRKLRATPPQNRANFGLSGKKNGSNFRKFFRTYGSFSCFTVFLVVFARKFGSKKNEKWKKCRQNFTVRSEMTRCSVRKFIEQNLPYTWFVSWYHTVKFCGEILTVFIRRPYIYFLKISVCTRYLSYSSTLLNFQDSYKLRLECWVVLGLEFWVLFD